MRTTLRMLVLTALVTMGTWAVTGPVHAQTPTDTAETPTDTATTDDDGDDEDMEEDEADEADEDAAAATAEQGDDDDDLPTTGAPVWLFAATGAGLLHIGGGMLLAERRQRRPDAYWEDHRA